MSERYFDEKPAERAPSPAKQPVEIPWSHILAAVVVIVLAVVLVTAILASALTSRPANARPAPTITTPAAAAASPPASPPVPTPSPTGQAPGAPLWSIAKDVVPESTTSTAWTPPPLDGTPAVYWEKNADGYCANYDTSEQPCTAIGATETGGVPPTGGTP